MERKKYKYIAYHDSLTDCYNRNYLDYEIKETFRNKYCIITLVDINNLKKINDTYGHLEGDKRIVDVANILKEFGITIRLGGDEFLIICSKKNKYERLKEYCESQKNFAYGFAVKDSKEEISSAMKKADERMYENKNKVKRNKLR
ncbi:MAG: GGDEF domain-containing protein [Bacilli bacterium]